MEKYLGMTEAEILKNERMWEEENTSGVSPEGDDMPGLGNVGVRGFDIPDGGDVDIDVDTASADDEGASPISGAEATGGDENA
jgi:hypothetical protein